MKELLTSYSIQEILMFIVLLALAIKGIVSWWEWAKGKLTERFERKANKRKVIDDLVKGMEELKNNNEKIMEKVDKINNTVDLLVASDKDDIKAYITREHHYFCYTLGYIDDYNLDCIERRYSHYEKEGGNSFVADLMGEIRALPKSTIEVTPYAVTSKIKEQEKNR